MNPVELQELETRRRTLIMQWSLEDIYKKQVRGNIPRRKHLHVLGEGSFTHEQEEVEDRIKESVEA